MEILYMILQRAINLQATDIHLANDMLPVYRVNKKLYFGELTFFTCSGFIPFEPIEWDLKLGEMLKLPFEKE